MGDTVRVRAVICVPADLDDPEFVRIVELGWTRPSSTDHGLAATANCRRCRRGICAPRQAVQEFEIGSAVPLCWICFVVGLETDKVRAIRIERFT